MILAYRHAYGKVANVSPSVGGRPVTAPPLPEGPESTPLLSLPPRRTVF
jgi:hypothetical protein